MDPSHASLTDLLSSDDSTDLHELVPDFPKAVASAVAATALRDGVLTSAEYRCLEECAGHLEGLSGVAGLMSYLILEDLDDGPSLEGALRALKSASKDVPEETRQGIFEAATPLLEAQHKDAAEVSRQWCKALRLEPGKAVDATGSKLLKQTLGLVDSARRLIPGSGRPTPLERARSMACIFDDDELRTSLDSWEEADGVADATIERALTAATQRALTRACNRLKSRDDLDQQLAIAERFRDAVELLVKEVIARLQTTEARLRLQSEMFAEDLDNFVEASLDRIEIEMRDLVQGRSDWTDPVIWESFKKGTAYSELQAKFEPLRRRYTQLFDQWNRELEMFAREAGAVRSTLLSTVDPRAFAALIPTDHSDAAIKAALDRVADATLGVTGLSALFGGGLLLVGKIQVATLAAFFSGPVGLAVGGAVGAAVAGAGLWKHFSNPERRKTKLIKSKRDVIRDGLKELLATEVLNHDQLAREILEKFVDAAREQYAPLLLEARICVLKARREKEVVRKVFRDTRSFLEIPPPPEVQA